MPMNEGKVTVAHEEAAVKLLKRSSLTSWRVSDQNLIAQALAAAELAGLTELESAMAHIKASGHAGSAIMSVPQILAWARGIGWQG